jgi:DNA-binding NarL/FixJ family response regulator
MIRVLLVDDDALVRSGLRLMLGGANDIEIVGELDDGAGLSTAVEEWAPDVVLLDIRMPGVDGITALRSLGSKLPAVIILTTLGGEDTVLDSLRHGAAGYLLKHTPPAQILAAVRAAAAGEPAVSPEALRHLIGHVNAMSGARAQPTGRLDVLSERERAVADALADGLGNADIARRLHLSPGTVKAHVSSALAKLGLENRTQLAIAAHEARSG